DLARLRPKVARHHACLGRALRSRGLAREADAATDAAIAVARAELRLKPDDATARLNLGNALSDKGQSDAAVAAYREAIRLQPDHAEAHCNLGFALQTQGRFAESLAEFERGHELGSKQPGWRYPSTQWVEQARRLAELEKKLPALLRGEAQPAD